MHASLDGASWAATASFLGSIVLPEKITVNFVFSASFVVLLPAILCYYVTQPLYAREGALLRNKLPLLVRHVIELVEQQSNGLTHKQDVREALRNAFLWFLALAVFRTAYEHFLNRYVTRLRGGIIALIIHKCHSLKEANAKRSAIIIRDDVAFITISTPKCLQIVIGFIEIGFGTYMLSQCMGVFALSLFLPLSASTVVAWFIWRPLVNQVHKWNEEIAARVEKSAHLLPQLNSIKILGLGSTLARLLQALRDHEIKVSMGYRYLQAVCYGPLLVGDLMPPVVAIAAALFGAAFQGRMSAKEVFPLLTNVFIIQRASGGFLETYAKKTSTLAAFHRIQDFLLLEEEKDSRFKGESNTQDQQETNLVRFNSVDIAPSGSKKPLIKSVDFKLAAGSISFLFGLPTSGKSTIINGILGQSETLGGSIHVYPDRIGYCDETAWLRDVSIRENIVCTSEFDRDRLDMVLQACFLDEDLAWLPGGEEYIAGVNGCRLTSGQRQRVGIARTAYAGYPLTILDNPFSALDHNTAIGIILSGASYLFSAWPIVLAAIFYIHQHYISTLGKVRRLDDQQSALLQKYFQETAAGSVHIAAFDWHKESISRGLMLLKESQLPFYTRLTIQQWLTMVLNFLCAGLGISVVGLALLIKQSSNASIIGLALLSLNTLSIAVHNTLSARIMFETASSVLARLSLFERETPQDIHRPTLNDLPSHWPSEGRIEFANVVAKYTPTDPEATPALHDVSLTISAGQRVGITGRGGSGKSSLLLAILGFIHYDGRIEIDGIDVQSVSCEDLRSRLVTITQEQVQFDTTIRANLLPFDMHSNLPVQEDEDDKLKQILKSLHIWVPLAEKGGLDAMMNEVGYSKDEKQLLCIARAIAKQRRTGSKVVLVDEATTTVKPAIAKIIHGVMKDYLTGCTILYLAHRAADLDNVDNVVRLRHGALLDEEDSRFESESSGDEDEE
ncbi:hypothetical protein PWT90_02170 [Aphanocladium album]|nr:hypothetical protein PWT90_02170 [Aphanocladium album]